MILDRVWLDGSTNNETKAHAAFLKATIALKKQQSNQAVFWWKNVLNVPFDKSFLSSKPKENKNLIQVKQFSAGSICQNLDREDRSLPYYCGLSYLLSTHMSNPYLYYIDECIRRRDRSLCGRLGVKLISDVITQDSNTHKRVITVKEDEKIFIDIALRGFIPNFKVSDLKSASSDDIIQLYWLAVALEGGYQNFEASSKIYADLCALPSKYNQNANQKIVRSCQVATNKNHWVKYSEAKQSKIAFEGCVYRNFTSACLKLISNGEGVKRVRDNFKLLSKIMSERYIENNDTEAYLMYYFMYQYEANRHLNFEKISISATNSKGSKWDLIGSPDPILEVRTSSEVLLYKGKLLIERERLGEITLTLDRGMRSLCFTNNESIVSIRIYDEDNTSLEMIGQVQLTGDTIGRHSLRQGSINSILVNVMEVKQSQHPFKRLQDALRKRSGK